jgi:hypothetical protein
MIRDFHLGGFSSWIRELDPHFDFLPITDPGVKKAPDPGSGSATLLSCKLFVAFSMFGLGKFPQFLLKHVLLRKPRKEVNSGFGTYRYRTIQIKKLQVKVIRKLKTSRNR